MTMPFSGDPYDSMRSKISEIKNLYLTRHYKKCTSCCLDAASAMNEQTNPIQKASIYFYMALSYDTLARGMYRHSEAFFETLRLAERYYLKAAEAVPSKIDATAYQLQDYNSNLTSFADMLESHIASVKRLTTTQTSASQSSRSNSPSSLSSISDQSSNSHSEKFSAKSTLSKCPPQMRNMQNLSKNTNGLTRARFSPERYKEICQRALAELP